MTGSEVNLFPAVPPGLSISAPTNGQVLTYNSALGLWTNQSLPGFGGDFSGAITVQSTTAITPTIGVGDPALVTPYIFAGSAAAPVLGLDINQCTQLMVARGPVFANRVLVGVNSVSGTVQIGDLYTGDMAIQFNSAAPMIFQSINPSGSVGWYWYSLISGVQSVCAVMNATGAFSTYNSIATVFGGLLAEYASTGATAVPLQTGATAITSYIPTVNALFLVMVNCTHVTATVAGTLTVTYTDAGSGVTATQTATIVSGAPGVSDSFAFLCNAAAGTAIAISGTSATGGDILATAFICQA